MAILELVDTRPNWLAALDVALTRRPVVPERRAGQHLWRPRTTGRPRRLADDLAWFRDAMDEPDSHGLRTLDGTAAVGAWESADDDHEVVARLQRLRDRGVLQAAGFLLHEPEHAEV